MTNIAAVGALDENIDDLRPNGATDSTSASPAAIPADTQILAPVPEEKSAPTPTTDGQFKASPRAKNLAARKHIDVANLTGSGPDGRIIERDVQAAVDSQPAMTPLARKLMGQGEYQAPAQGSGVSGRIMSGDLVPTAPAATKPTPAAPSSDQIEIVPVKGIRRVIANRMLESLQTTAQLTLNSTADARAIQHYRKQLKAGDEALGLGEITINDLILFAVSRTLPQFPAVNALFNGDNVAQYKNVHLAFAVDTPRGLVVPVIRNASSLSLKQIAIESKQLAAAAQSGKINPDELTGGTFTVTNLGNLGIDSFTPVLNPPQVAILGVGGINLKPVQAGQEVEFVPHLGLSLTINHQVVDGAPGARFLQTLARGLANIELLLAL
jgi:pyruvate dehydrogenase E2 component (dihydrolipoamide acetyltransferase)